MKTIKRIIKKWLNADDAVENEKGLAYVSPSLTVHSDSKIHFAVARASGGIVVEVSSYTRNSEHRSLHIITDDQDIGESLSKILFLEQLKN
jgi:hypothetical protein